MGEYWWTGRRQMERQMECTGRVQGSRWLPMVNFSTIRRLGEEEYNEKVRRKGWAGQEVEAKEVEKKYEDAYIVSILIGLAQEQAKRECRNGGSSREGGKDHVVHVIEILKKRAKKVYVYTSSMSRAFLEKLEELIPLTLTVAGEKWHHSRFSCSASRRLSRSMIFSHGRTTDPC